jgi:23S rRNA 5-hydroxycytidine C2501 synthase
MKQFKTLELLAPARDIECGIAAINHGADAVYVGAPRFGARAAAGNSLSDISALIAYAHKFRARVYVTLNTVLFDNELEDVRTLVGDLYDAGIDALIFQDMALLEMDIPPIPLFASTQTHNYDIEKIKFLEAVGVQRIILARELSLAQIAAIRQATSVELEAFIHGALCVSFSGQCYFSEAMKGRSANRGECAQMCRLPYTLTDARGNVLARNQHLLSLKDLNLADYLTDLVDRGITSFKIEGRLKDAGYVKNITAFYRAQLDALMAGHTDMHRASSGTTHVTFTPDPSRSFNRGFTEYFIRRRNRTMVSLQTPKAIGAPLGRVKDIGPDFFTLDTGTQINNGDGICFFDEHDELRGVNINNVVRGRIHPNLMAGIERGTVIYRNHDHEFEKQLRTNTAQRTIGVTLELDTTPDGFILRATDEDGVQATASVQQPHEPAGKPDEALQTIERQCARMGETSYTLREFHYLPDAVWFIPASVLNALRRACIAALDTGRAKSFERIPCLRARNNAPYPSTSLDRYANVVNETAAAFYRRHGVEHVERGVELQKSFSGTTLMTTRYCLKYQFDLCKGERGSAEELFLSDGRNTFRLEFDCDRCVMNIVAP